MKKILLSAILSFSITGNIMAQGYDKLWSPLQGEIYDAFQERFAKAYYAGENLPTPAGQVEAMALVDFYADLIDSNTDKSLGDHGQIQTWLLNNKLPLEERWRLAISATQIVANEKSVKAINLVVTQVEKILAAGQASRQLVALSLANEEQIKTMFGTDQLLSLAESKYPEVSVNFKKKTFTPMTKADVREMFYFIPQWSRIRDSYYADGVKLFLFCRRDRNYPCLFVAKDKFDLPLLDSATGQLWHQPALAASSSGYSSRVRNGQTPTGVQTLDSVMPTANLPVSFGKFRRVILNWLPDMQEEDQTLSLLPPSLHTQTWWRESLISRDVGRVDLRIHGTGKINEDPTSTFFPFRQTSGCISQREGQYGQVEYRDQRKMLDSLMSAMDLESRYENETAIKGVLYLVELDDAKKAVEFDDVRKLLQD